MNCITSIRANKFARIIPQLAKVGVQFLLFLKTSLQQAWLVALSLKSDPRSSTYNEHLFSLHLPYIETSL